MYSKIRDSRLRYTKHCLFKALLSKLETKRLSNITVSEICDKASVSPKTFYKYYADAFALLLGMQDDLFVGFEAELEEVPANIFDVMPVLIGFVNKHRVLIRATFENRGEGNFIDRVVSYLYEAYKEDWEQANPDMSTLEVRFLFQYVVSGIIGTLRLWLLEFSDMESDEILSRIDYLLKLSTPSSTRSKI